MHQRHVFAILLAAAAGCATKQTPATPRSRLPPPTWASLKYGPHERNVLDLWLARSPQPTPLVLFIHGGAFRRGDKGGLAATDLKDYLDAGFSVASINYRFTTTAPAPAAYLDCTRALQFLRYHAQEWNLDPTLVASTGGSAGAGTSMWIGFHDDMADPKSPDPVARESTRLTAIAVENGQSSYSPLFAEQIGLPRPNFERHDFFLLFYGITDKEIDTPKAYQRYSEMAPITYLTSDDPPVLLQYSLHNVNVTSSSDLNQVVHHPRFGYALKERMNALGVEAVVNDLDTPPAERVKAVDFIRKQFERARQRHAHSGQPQSSHGPSPRSAAPAAQLQ